MLVLKSDGSDFGRLGNLFAMAGKNAPRAVRLAVKEVGMLARTQMRRGIREELGPQKAIAKQVNKRVIGMIKSGGAGAEYHITARGTIPLRYLKTVQTPGGVIVPGVKTAWIGGAKHLAKSFEGQTGHAGTRGNAAKRRASLGFHIMHRKGEKRSPLAITEGVILAKVFVAHKPKAAFFKAAEKLPDRLARLLFAAATGALRAHRGFSGRAR